MPLPAYAALTHIRLAREPITNSQELRERYERLAVQLQNRRDAIRAVKRLINEQLLNLKCMPY